MLNTLTILSCLNSCLDTTTLNRLKTIVTAMLTMTGRVTMLGISRWTDEGGSYRTVQRFFNTRITWENIHWRLIRQCFLDATDIFILAGDETVVTKAGKMTYGLNRFFSSIYGKPVPGLDFFTLSLISTKQRTSYPLITQQMAHSEDKKKRQKTQLLHTIAKISKIKANPQQKGEEVGRKAVKIKTKRMLNYHLIY